MPHKLELRAVSCNGVNGLQIHRSTLELTEHSSLFKIAPERGVCANGHRKTRTLSLGGRLRIGCGIGIDNVWEV